jgi:hypothetical protein
MAVLMQVSVAAQKKPERQVIPQALRTDTTVIWRGFDQKWTSANHRLNRLGDYIGGINCGSSPCSANLVHSAASGLAGDIARYTTYYTTISARGVGFQSGHRTFVLSGKEGHAIVRDFPVTATADANMKNRGQYVVILNGFDLCAEDAADKPEHFRLALTNPTYDPAQDKLSFKVIAELTADCTSAECVPPDTVNYNLRVHYVIIAAESESFNKVSRNFSSHYTWDKEDEIHLRDLDEDHVLYGAAGFPVGVFAFRSLEVNLDRDHWMFEWASFVRPLSYNQQSGEGKLNLALMFKQWVPGMIAGAQKKSGDATITARVILLQFKQANRRNDSYNGSLEWPGTLGGAPSGACTGEATTTHAIHFEAGM